MYYRFARTEQKQAKKRTDPDCSAERIGYQFHKLRSREFASQLSDNPYFKAELAQHIDGAFVAHLATAVVGLNAIRQRPEKVNRQCHIFCFIGFPIQVAKLLFGDRNNYICAN